jgi:hypothetical protein
MKFTGNLLSDNDVVSLKRGDVYWLEAAGAPRVFERYSPNGNIINTSGALNKIENVRWLSAEEKAYWSKINPDLFKPLKKAKVQPKESTMSQNDSPVAVTEDVSFMDRFKEETVDAGYRVAATQMSKGVKAGLVLALEKKGMDNGKIVAVKDLLESEVGTALIQVLLGYALPYVPGVKNDPRGERLSKEFRVGGTAVAGNVVIGTAMEYLLPAIQEAMKSLPDMPSLTETAKSRVTALPKKANKETLAEAIGESEEEAVTEPKRAQA